MNNHAWNNYNNHDTKYSQLLLVQSLIFHPTIMKQNSYPDLILS